MIRGNLPAATRASRTALSQKSLSSSAAGNLYVFCTTASTSGVTPPGRKSVYLFLGDCRASWVAGYQISVTSVRGSLVKASVRLGSTKTVVVTPTGNGPGARGSLSLEEGSCAQPGHVRVEVRNRTASGKKFRRIA